MHPFKETSRRRYTSTDKIVFQIECKKHVLCRGERIFLVQKEMSKSHLMTARENTWNDEKEEKLKATEDAKSGNKEEIVTGNSGCSDEKK